MSRGLAYRRHQERRIKQRVRTVLIRWRAWARDTRFEREIGPDEVGRYAHHGLAICSCPLCGNPRRHFGDLPIQELRALPAPEA